MASNNPETIRFDVGGTKYRVSRSTIEMWPNTMLARLISDEWNDGESDQELFIDRDGERFRFVLDYMRDKKVHLPMTVAKDAVLKELEYFGFDTESAATVLHVGSESAIQHQLAGIDIKKLKKKINGRFDELERIVRRATDKRHRRRITLR